MTTTKTSDLDVVLYLYETFAMYTADVAAHFGLTQGKAWKTLKNLEAKGLIVGFDNEDDSRRWSVGKRVRVGKNLMWQCSQTYDDYTREEVTAWATEKLAALETLDCMVSGEIPEPFWHETQSGKRLEEIRASSF